MTAPPMPLRAMLLCAGLGTRLGALSDERPKPLLPVCDVPILRYGLALLEAAGVREVAVNLHHRGDLIEEELARGAGALALRFSREEILLGTGGGVQRLAGWLTDGWRRPFLILNGKLILDADLPALLAAHEASGAEATMLLRAVPDADRWGRVELDGDRVVGLRGQRAPGYTEQTPATVRGTMFTGVHVVSPALVRRLPEGISDIIGEAYLPMLREGLRIGGVLYDGYFQEHSTPERYLDGNFALLRAPGALRHPPSPLAGVDAAAAVADDVEIVGPVRVGAGATIGAGARLGPEVVVGRGARVEPGARLERVVVWPGAIAEGELHEAIVTPRGPFLLPRG